MHEHLERPSLSKQPGRSLLLLLAFGHLTIDMHAGGLPVIFPQLKEAYALSYTQIGGLMLLSQFTSSMVQPIFGLFSDRISTRWILPVSLALATTGLLIVSFAPSYGVVLAGVALMGLGIAAYHPEASKVAHFVGGHRKGRSMSIFALGGNVGVALGPVTMTAGLASAGLKGALIYLPVTILVIFLVQSARERLYDGWSTSGGFDQTQPSRQPRTSGGNNFIEESPDEKCAVRAHQFQRRAMILLLAVIMLRSSAHTALLTFIPLYYTDFLGNSAAYSSLLLTLFLLAGAAGTALGGTASDRYGPRLLILLSFVISAPLIGVLPYFTQGISPFIIAVLAGVPLISSFAITTVLGQTLLPTRVGLASGLTLGFSVGTGGIGVTALGFVADKWGLPTALFSIAALLLLGALVSLALPSEEETHANLQAVQSSS